MKNLFFTILFLIAGVFTYAQEVVGNYDARSDQFTVTNADLLQQILSVDLPANTILGKMEYEKDVNSDALMVWRPITNTASKVSAVAVLLKYNEEDGTVQFFSELGPGIKIKYTCRSQGSCTACTPKMKRGSTSFGGIVWPTIICECDNSDQKDDCITEAEVEIEVGI